MPDLFPLLVPQLETPLSCEVEVPNPFPLLASQLETPLSCEVEVPNPFPLLVSQLQILSLHIAVAQVQFQLSAFQEWSRLLDYRKSASLNFDHHALK